MTAPFSSRPRRRLAQDGAADVALVVGQHPDQGGLRTEADPLVAGLGQVLGHDQQFGLGFQGHDAWHSAVVLRRA